MEVNAGTILIEARRRSGLSRRGLARLAGTSAATLTAYEAGRSVPSVQTLQRLLDAAGFEAEVTLRPKYLDDEQARREKIEAIFAFVDEMPRRHRGELRFPRFPTAPVR